MGFFTKDIKTLDDLFVHTLRDIYYAEQQIAKSLPDMIEKATDQTLKNGFETHLAETKGQIVRLEKVLQMHGVEAKGVDCPAIDISWTKRAKSRETLTTRASWMRP
jgi:ferritin-like metal-binding protein YciE